MKKLILPILFAFAAMCPAFAQDIKQEIAQYEKQIQDQLKGYQARYDELTHDPGDNSLKNNLAAYKYRFGILEGWIADEDAKLRKLETGEDRKEGPLTFNVYTSARYKALLNQYEALVREFEAWYKKVPDAKQKG